VEYLINGYKRASSIPPAGAKGRTASVIIVDDNIDIRETNAELLRGEGFGVFTYDPACPDPAVMAKTYDVAVIDMIMPNTDGFAIREEILKHSPFAQFIIITAYPKREMLDRAMDLGVFAFLTKPFSAEQIRYAVMGALRMQALLRRNQEHEIFEASESMGLIGRSKIMTDVRRKICELAPLDVPVLVTGESGTGKEVVARCIHAYSRRSKERFTAINCAGLSPSLIESELFGHAQGAFTGATQTRHGYFEVSDGGTLFLDEIGDLPLDLQSRLLRTLDTGEYNRVGDTESRKTNVRIVCATNKDIAAMVKGGTFRKDLFYRIYGGNIQLAPLRERKEDIPVLAHYFLPKEEYTIAPDALDAIVSYDWPGNVRQLKMAMQHLSGVAAGKIITRENVANVLGKTDDNGNDGENSRTSQTYREFKNRVIFIAEKEYFQSLIDTAKGNIAQAARNAGMDRKNIYEKLKQMDISTTPAKPF
jgi:DNA-binding NtrC family response regulator